MNHDLELKLQAWLDGELPADEAARFSQAMASDSDARQLIGELTAIKAAMAHNELAVKVPETREFYWSQIERRIQRETPAPVRSTFDLLVTQWRRFLVPLAGTAAVLALLVVSVKQSIPVPVFAEVTDTASDMEAVTFHDQSAGMTVVWLQLSDRASEKVNKDSVPDFFDIP